MTERFLLLAEEYARYATAAGKRIHRAPPAEARRLFEKNEDARQRALIHRLEVDLAIFAEMTAAGESLTDSRRLLWRHLGKSGCAPRSDLFDKIHDTDVVEIYGLDQIHLCQSLSFFDWISHTLEQIFCEPWYELVRRDPRIERELAELARRIVHGEIRETFAPGLPWHVVEEVATAELKKFHFHLKHLSPVIAGGRLNCFVAVSECRKV